MIGYQPLRKMRLNGRIPARGVRIEAGVLDALAPVLWDQQRSSMAVVRVSTSEQIEDLDLRFVAALPVILVAEAGVQSEWLDDLMLAIERAKAASVTVLRIEAEWLPNGSAWVSTDAFELVNGERQDLDPATVFARAFS